MQGMLVIPVPFDSITGYYVLFGNKATAYEITGEGVVKIYQMQMRCD
jgi:hypothetical protein